MEFFTPEQAEVLLRQYYREYLGHLVIAMFIMLSLINRLSRTLWPYVFAFVGFIWLRGARVPEHLSDTQYPPETAWIITLSMAAMLGLILMIYMGKQLYQWRKSGDPLKQRWHRGSLKLMEVFAWLAISAYWDYVWLLFALYLGFQLSQLFGVNTHVARRWNITEKKTGEQFDIVMREINIFFLMLILLFPILFYFFRHDIFRRIDWWLRDFYYYQTMGILTF